jgi:hypothetical protein
MITLRELARTRARADVIDIRVSWNDEDEDYEDVLGFSKCGDLQEIVDSNRHDISKYLDYNVLDIEVDMYDPYHTFLKIEIER